MKTYEIRRVHGPVPLIGEASSLPWSSAQVAQIDEFPWYKGGKRQATQVRLLYDDEAMYAQFVCEDSHIFAQETRLNGSVYKDSCVELFASLAPDRGEHYFNLEVNCCGVFMLGFGPGRPGRKLITPQAAPRVEIRSSEGSAPRDETPADNGWWIAVRLPFDVLSELAGWRIAPAQGSKWRGNFYRCGGKTDDQYGMWAPIQAPQPDFHRPEQFGQLTFA